MNIREIVVFQLFELDSVTRQFFKRRKVGTLMK